MSIQLSFNQQNFLECMSCQLVVVLQQPLSPSLFGIVRKILYYFSQSTLHTISVVCLVYNRLPCVYHLALDPSQVAPTWTQIIFLNDKHLSILIKYGVPTYKCTYFFLLLERGFIQKILQIIAIKKECRHTNLI